jgi:hypothetical protein
MRNRILINVDEERSVSSAKIPELDLPESASIARLRAFFNTHHDKLLCTANRAGEPSVALMGTPRLNADGTVDFEISDPVSTTLDNIQENPSVVFIAYVPGPRARDYAGARVYARIEKLLTEGEELEAIRQGIFDRHGAKKAADLQATVRCRITRVRPIVDRGQPWNEAASEEILDGAKAAE